ncbi:SWI/SNF-related matrix-associated actin-dependent regulator of chromatin subfamily D member 1-like [Oscarella lobularis]|uniref:SWI/SNF-related matrix-associated actin-dependent regulator of chromatin subfamily D member 1-like n=1 Tax=Oscarella lobularis TaxID=121494 RepID=UPI0033140269
MAVPGRATGLYGADPRSRLASMHHHHPYAAANPQSSSVAAAAAAAAADPRRLSSAMRGRRNRMVRVSAVAPPPVQPRVTSRDLSHRIRELVPESQMYVDLLTFEKKLDYNIMRKRLDIQEALKRPVKRRCKLRIFITHQFYLGHVGVESIEPSWELKVEGRILDDSKSAARPGEGTAAALTGPAAAETKPTPSRKFSSFFKNVVIEVDKDMYGPDNHLVEWHRTSQIDETDGFQLRRKGDKSVKCTIFLMLDNQPPQYKLDVRLARLLGIHTQTRPVIINALWTYIKTHKLQDPNERDYINCDACLSQIFEVPRMKFSEIPQRLQGLLMASDPIVITHLISNDAVDRPKTSCYDLEIDVDDTLKQQMNAFLLSTASQQEIASLEAKIQETIQTINSLKTKREFFKKFSDDPHDFIQRWLMSQNKDIKSSRDISVPRDEERRAGFYDKPWTREAVYRYFYGKVEQMRAELAQALNNS